MRRDVHLTANAKLEYVLRALDEGLTCTEVSADNMLSIVQAPHAPHHPDSAYSLCEYFLKANPRIQGVAIAYVDNVLPNQQEGYCPYVMHMEDGTYKRMDLALVKDYRHKPWFVDAVKKDSANWSEPYIETNGTVVSTYSVPIKNPKGEITAVLALDLSLDVVNQHLQSLNPYPHSIMALMDKSRRFIAHPNKDYILKAQADSLMSGYHYVEGEDRSMYTPVVDDYRGYGTIQTEKDKLIIFYMPEPKTGWTVLLEVPQSDIVGGLQKMRNVIMLIMLLGIVMLISVCLAVIGLLSKPLETFANAARQISTGDFNIQLPEVTEHNELWDLRQAIASMKESLNNYMDKLEETTKSKALIESELNIARKIQMAMVPKIFPPYPERKELDLYGTLIPAKAVGGDLYDFVLDGDDFYFCIGDVSGKGVPASLFMAITRSLFRNNVTHAKSPAALATLLNNALAQGNDENMFVTMFIGCCNLVTGKFTCCNCGHNAPATNGHIISVDPVTAAPGQAVHLMEKAPINLPIGVMEGFPYQEISMQLQPGVKIMLYTDGITEAENTEAELYGDEQLLSFLSTLSANDSAEKAVKSLIDDVHRHANGAEQSDDITVLCMSYKLNEL